MGKVKFFRLTRFWWEMPKHNGHKGHEGKIT
jgi:hypothetical protein